MVTEPGVRQKLPSRSHGLREISGDTVLPGLTGCGAAAGPPQTNDWRYGALVLRFFFLFFALRHVPGHVGILPSALGWPSGCGVSYPDVGSRDRPGDQGSLRACGALADGGFCAVWELLGVAALHGTVTRAGRATVLFHLAGATSALVGRSCPGDRARARSGARWNGDKRSYCEKLRRR
jgi:hypothetical protein